MEKAESHVLLWLFIYVSGEGGVIYSTVVVLACDWLQVEKAESVLLEIKRLIDKQTDQSSEQFETEVKQLSDEFYSHLPHNNKHNIVINSKRLIANKQQLCQVLLNSYAFAANSH